MKVTWHSPQGLYEKRTKILSTFSNFISLILEEWTDECNKDTRMPLNQLTAEEFRSCETDACFVLDKVVVCVCLHVGWNLLAAYHFNAKIIMFLVVVFWILYKKKKNFFQFRSLKLFSSVRVATEVLKDFFLNTSLYSKKIKDKCYKKLIKEWYEGG